MSEILNQKKVELLSTSYEGCITTKQFQNVYTAYLGSQFKLLKLPIVLKKLQGLMDKNLEMSEVPTDKEVLDFSKNIEEVSTSINGLKNKNFDGLEFIAMTYIFADHQV